MMSEALALIGMSPIIRLEVLVERINRIAKKIPLNALLIQLRGSEYRLSCVDVIVDEFFVNFIVAKNLGAESDIQETSASLEVLISNLSRLKLSWFEKVAVKCRQKYHTSNIEQHECSTLAHKKFELFALLYHWVSHRSFYSDELENKRVRLLSGIFHEPEDKVKRMIVENKCYSWKFRKSRERYLSESFESAFRIVWPQRSAYRHYTNCSIRSRVLITIHMGDFLGALREVSVEGDPNRRVISIREGDDLDVYQNLIPNSMRHEVINRHSVLPQSIVSRLREGNTTVVALTDLHGHFGETQRVRFLGVDMDFVKGPVLMAVLGRADVVPVVTFDEGGINCLHTGPILYSRRNPDESLDLTLSRLMQKLFTWFEDYVSSKPEQWKYFPDSPAFLSHIDR